jgi:hypothetical protein
MLAVFYITQNSLSCYGEAEETYLPQADTHHPENPTLGE